MIGKGNYRHYMLKEIFEQPSAIGDTLGAYYNPGAQRVALPALPFALERVERVTIVACGTSYYAGLAARYWIEQTARVPVEIDIASEFRYRAPPLAEGSVALFISQSGETADTLAALRYAREAGAPSAAVVNVRESTMAREADAVLPTYAGVEIGVASTKAFTTQLVTLACFAISLWPAPRGAIDAAEEARLTAALAHVPAHAADVLGHDERLLALAETLRQAETVLYIGRGTGYPIAMEGALKLKELSYIHAEGFAAGELKHGPIALVDRGVPVIVVAPTGPLFDKTASNLREAAARGAHVSWSSAMKRAARRWRRWRPTPSRCPRSTRSSRPSSTRSRSSSSPTTWRCSRGPTWISPATWRNRSPWNERSSAPSSTSTTTTASCASRSAPSARATPASTGGRRIARARLPGGVRAGAHRRGFFGRADPRALRRQRARHRRGRGDPGRDPRVRLQRRRLPRPDVHHGHGAAARLGSRRRRPTCRRSRAARAGCRPSA